MGIVLMFLRQGTCLSACIHQQHACEHLQEQQVLYEWFASFVLQREERERGRERIVLL